MGELRLRFGASPARKQQPRGRGRFGDGAEADERAHGAPSASGAVVDLRSLTFALAAAAVAVARAPGNNVTDDAR